SRAPPALRVAVNGRAFEVALPAGASDASVFGEPRKGKPHSFQVAFPSELLRPGDNQVRITTLKGSWLLYDALRLEAPAGAEAAPVQARTLLEAAEPLRALRRDGDGERLLQTVRVTLFHIGEPVQASVRVEGAEPVRVELARRSQSVEVRVPAVEREEEVEVAVEVAVEAEGKPLASARVVLKPVRKLTVYVLPHSHTDIGYTEIQSAVEEKQVKNLLDGIAHARRTAGYPEGARFVWNVEVLWAADLYLRRLSEAQRVDFLDAVRRGQVALNGMYLNELTGLCRPEELLRLFRFATRLSELCGAPVDAAMISDVPGYTWGTVTALAHAGIRYFSVAPNYFDRIGDILAAWENKPFWWVGPSGRERVLVWVPHMGYALSHVIGKLTPRFVEDYQAQLDKSGYPFDIAYLRWSGHGDNAVPDPSICEFVKEWNESHAWPRFAIASTSEAFRAFEERHGGELPRFQGDWTPFWEDGAGSSALETAMNRATSDRLAQAEALWAMLDPASYPAEAFEEAWRGVLLYSEHTWGAWCSVSDPESQATREQWEVKRSYAVAADARSRELLGRILGAGPVASGAAAAAASCIDVFNATSWPRTELVLVPKELSAAGDRVAGAEGRPVPSQRLSTGELAFAARDVPPFEARRYAVSPGAPHVEGKAEARGDVLENGALRVRLDGATGAVVELRARGIEEDLVDAASGHALNDYLFLPGDDLSRLERSGPAAIRVLEKGPLVASLLVESKAPGCRKLLREVRLAAGFDHLWLADTVDKERAQANPKPGDWSFAQKGGKESVSFAFPFRVPGGEVRLETPFALMRPEADQIPGSCKNWFTAGRWADVSNAAFGVSLVTLDAPLVQVGGITATLLGSQTNPAVWRKRVEPTQRLYVWAMNNHWGTNYRAYQDGPVTFRFALRPHGRYDPAEASRFAIGLSQPLLVAPARGAAPRAEPLLRVRPGDVLATALKPSDDGKALIVRLFGASGEARSAAVEWGGGAARPRSVRRSDTSERPGPEVTGPVEVPGLGLVTLRAEVGR
ncbi:MAG: hypothetical protein HY721_24480, partial [Planctomycetes bacterium]|nr:hypothetical protein [Planctomycetota bacterium]